MIGALNVYTVRQRELTDRDSRLGLALADMATVGLIHQRASDQQDLVRQQLQHALDSRVIIEQAKGVLSQRKGISPEAAFDRLRGHARSHNQKIAETSRAVVDEQLDV